MILRRKAVLFPRSLLFPFPMIWFAYAVLGLSLVLVLVRLLRGPSLSDRVIALDMLSFIAIGVIAVYTVATQSAVMMDAALVLALIAFLGTVAFARYVERHPSSLDTRSPTGGAQRTGAGSADAS